MSEIQALAYVKMYLHLAKYPELAVNGVLLTDNADDQSATHLNFVDCIPLFHGVLSLSPMLEIALSQIDAYCSKQNLKISGYYHANQNYSDNNPSLTALKIMEKIKDNNPNALLFMIENNLIGLEEIERFYKVLKFDEKNWQNVTDSHQINEKSRLLALHLLKRKEHRLLIDFDNHFDSISNDWRNPLIKNELQTAAF